jgi:integrase
MPPMVKLPDLVKPQLKIPDIDDVKRILEVAKGSEMEIPILLGAFAPLRRSEIVPLTLDDIEGNIIRVNKAVVMDENGKNITKGTKTYDSTRLIPMPEHIIQKIMDKGYVTDIKNPQHISQRFEHIARKAGCQGTRFHDLRHFCASYLHSIGIPEQYILARGGWTTDGVMKNVYRHTLESGEDRIGKVLLQSMNDTFFE